MKQSGFINGYIGELAVHLYTIIIVSQKKKKYIYIYIYTIIIKKGQHACI